MKKVVSLSLIFCMVLCLCSCSQTGNVPEKSEITVVENEKSKAIVASLGTMAITDVFDDIAPIDLYLKPDFKNKKYNVKTVKNKENGTNDRYYYMDSTLVYIECEVDGAEEFVHFTKTASGLEAKVSYFTDSAGMKSVGMETETYTVYANCIDKTVPYGMRDTNITLFSDKGEEPFACSATYRFESGTATFDYATYLENGNYQRYFLYIDPEDKQDEYLDTLVAYETPKTNDEVVRVLQSDKSYGSACVLIDRTNTWYYDGDNWYVKADLSLLMDNQKQAEEYVQRNRLEGEVVTEGDVTVTMKDVVFAISQGAILKDGKLPSYITEDTDYESYKTITLDDSGKITGLK